MTRTLTTRSRIALPLIDIAPNWFASVMGTAIVAVAAAGLPQQEATLHGLAIAFWLLASGLLLLITTLVLVTWLRRTSGPGLHLADPVMSQFYGAPPMALLAVGAATLVAGQDVLGARLATDVDWVLWTVGTVVGLVVAARVPCLMFTRHRTDPDAAFGGWLMPVVPPMVSASTGALLAPYAAEGQVRLNLVIACLAMFGMSLIASLTIITLIWNRLAVHKTHAPAMVPTLWIILGPLGQSITAANLLSGVAADALPARYAPVLRALGVVYGIPVWGFAALWAAIATTITIRTARTHLPFTLSWWSFTFPIGTWVTGTSGLAAATGADLFRLTAPLLFTGLVSAWFVVATLTARHLATPGNELPLTSLAVQPTGVTHTRAVTSAAMSPTHTHMGNGRHPHKTGL